MLDWRPAPGVPHAPVRRHARHRDQHLLAPADQPRRLPGKRVLPARRAPHRCPAHVHGPAVRLPPARRRGGLHAGRGQLLRRQPGRHHQPGRLRVHARRDPGPAAGRPAGRRRAARPARRHGRLRLRRRGGRHHRARTRHRRQGLRDRRRARSALPHDAEAHSRLRHHRLLQGIPAHRRGRAGRGCARSRPGQAPGQDQAGHVALRLPAAADVSDDRAADARLRRPHQGAWRARTASCRSPSCTAFPMPTCPRTRAACW